MVIGGAEIFLFVCGVDDVFHEHPAVAGVAIPIVGERVAGLERAIEIIVGEEHERMAQAMKALIAQPHRCIGITGGIGLLFEFGLARVFARLRVNFVAADKPLDGAVIAARMTGLVTGGKRIMNIAFEKKCFPADRMNHRVTVAPQFGVIRF